MQRTWEDNAQEFGALIKQGKDVRLALLVACSVEKVAHGGARRGSSSNQNLNRKENASAFAEVAATSTARVLRHLDAWDRFAEMAGLQKAVELSPDDVGMELTDAQIEMFAKDITLGTSTSDAIKGNPTAVADLLANDGDFLDKVVAKGGVVQAVLGSKNVDPDEYFAGLSEDAGLLKPEKIAEAVASNPDVADAIAASHEATKAVNEAEGRTETGRQLARDAARRQNEQDARDGETVYHLRGLKALPVMMEAENLAEFVETKVARDPEDIALARNYGEWMQMLGRRLVAWADGDTLPLSDDAFREGIDAILGGAK